jgi:hypothetical protein
LFFARSAKNLDFRDFSLPCRAANDFTVSHETNSLPGNKMYVVRLKKFSLQKLPTVTRVSFLRCQNKTTARRARNLRQLKILRFPLYRADKSDKLYGCPFLNRTRYSCASVVSPPHKSNLPCPSGDDLVTFLSYF